MSKSKGTMHTLRELTAKGIDPAAVRLELIKTHYRANADFSMQGLKDSAKRIDRWRFVAQRLQYAVQNDQSSIQFPAMNQLRGLFVDGLNDDLNISRAISSMDAAFKMIQGNAVHEATQQAESIQLPDYPMSIAESLSMFSQKVACVWQLGLLHLIDNILGVIFRPLPKFQDTGIALYQPGVTPSEEIESLLTQRRDAKQSKDFAAADAIRDQLASMGLSIMDKPGGKVEVAPAN